MLKGSQSKIIVSTICTGVLSTFICAALLESATAAPQAPGSKLLTGTVLGPDGKPLEGVTISARESQKDIYKLAFSRTSMGTTLLSIVGQRSIQGLGSGCGI